jgi:hypothetical protein
MTPAEFTLMENDKCEGGAVILGYHCDRIAVIPTSILGFSIFVFNSNQHGMRHDGSTALVYL